MNKEISKEYTEVQTKEIKRLNAELKAKDEALRGILSYTPQLVAVCLPGVINIAEKGLKGK